MPEYTDQEQVDMIKKWWNDYGKFIAIAVVVGLLIGFGWRYYNQHELQRAEQASAIYQSMGLASEQKNANAVKTYADQLTAQYPKSPYASLANFLLAKEMVGVNNLNGALMHLQWVVKNSKIKSYQQMARLRAARVLLAQKQPEKAMKMLAVVNDKNFAPLISSVKGDIYSAQGKQKMARAAYLKAKNGFMVLNTADPLINMKLAQG